MVDALRVRSLHIESGNCVEGDAVLFNQLDSGKTALRTAAEKSCSACPERDRCISRLSELSVRFAEAGIQSTVIAGTRLDLQPPDESARQRLSRSYFEDGRTRHIEYRRLPDWFLSEFSQAQPGSLLIPIRKLARERNSRVGISGHKWNKHARTLQPHVQDLCLPTGNFTEKDTKKMQDDVCKFFSRIELNLNTFRVPDINKLRALTLEYIRDCEAVKILGFDDPLAVALNYSPDECTAALENPKYTQELTPRMIMEAFDQNANADAMLERFCRWFPEAQNRYAANMPALTQGALRHLILRAARKDNEDRVAVFVEEFLARFAAVQRLCADMPSVRDYDIRMLALHYSSPEEAVATLEGRREMDDIDSWQPVLGVSDGSLNGYEELSIRGIAFFNQISEDVVQHAIDRIDLADMPIYQREIGNETETVYGRKMLIDIGHQLSGRRLEDFQDRFLLNDRRMQKVRAFLGSSGYRIFEGDICSPEAYQLLCNNIAIFYQDNY